MMDYNTFREQVVQNIGGQYDDTNGQILVSVGGISFTLYDNDLRLNFDKIEKKEKEGAALFDQHKFEIALKGNYFYFPHLVTDSADSANHIKYSLNTASAEYVLNALSQNDEAHLLIIPDEIKHHREKNFEGNINFDMAFHEAATFLTLTIESEESLNLEEYKQLLTSYQYDFMFRTGRDLSEYCSILDLPIFLSSQPLIFE